MNISELQASYNTGETLSIENPASLMDAGAGSVDGVHEPVRPPEKKVCILMFLCVWCLNNYFSA
jgi:hypothetical protein